MFRIAFVSREVFPFPPSAGLGAYVTAAATALAEIAEVTIVTTDLHQPRYEQLKAESSPLLPDERVRFAFAGEPRPEETIGYFDAEQLWSDRAFRKLKELYPDGGPDLAEFPDYLGEAAVTVQAVNTLDPSLRNTLVCIRLYTTKEMVDVLNGHLPSRPEWRVAADLERYALTHGHRVLWPGGAVLDAYERFYGGKLAPARLVRHAVLPVAEADGKRRQGEELRLLYVGRLERRKGVQNLVRAAAGLASDHWQLTLVGGDTKTGSLGTSMRDQLLLAAADNARIEFIDRVPRRAVFELLAESDVVVAPSLWECWPNLVLEAMSQNRPVLSTPVGGHVELVEDGETGWLAADASEDALGSALERLVDEPSKVEAIASGGKPRERFARLSDSDDVREAYSNLAVEARERRLVKRRRSSATVSVVVPYHRVADYVEETVESIFAQTYRDLEVVVVNDGSFDPEDQILPELAERFPLSIYTQQNSGLGRARNFGVLQSRGKYVLPLDPDDVIEPSFVERCVDVLDERPDVAYVNCWVRYVDPEGRQWGPSFGGYRPFSNSARSLDVLNTAGAATAVFRRRVFDLGYWYSASLPSYEDWLHYRDLAVAGLTGHTIPERLLRYRVRPESMFRQIAEPHRLRLLDEMATHVRAQEVQWTS